MAIKATVPFTFARGDRTPASILWSGIVEWVNPDKMNSAGFPERVLRVQCSMVQGKNGPFLSMPYITRYDPEQRKMVPVLSRDGKYRNHVDVGPALAGMAVTAILAELEKPTRSDLEDRRQAAAEAEQASFDDLPF